jgi:hypothetical protein
MEASRCKKLKSLNQLLMSFQSPEIQLQLDKHQRVMCYEFDPTFQHLFAGFDNGEVPPLSWLIFKDRLHRLEPHQE